jgi:hypothetical protein
VLCLYTANKGTWGLGAPYAAYMDPRKFSILPNPETNG